MTGGNDGGKWKLLQRIAFGFILILFVPLAIVHESQAEAPPDPVRLGIVESLVKDIPKPLIKVTIQPFRALMQAQTGFSCEIGEPTEALRLGQRIANKEVELGVFQGVEFAWLHEKHSELRPLVIIVNVHPNRQAHLILRSDDPAAKIEDLKGKNLAIPRHSREHCPLFIERACRKSGQPMNELFAHVDTSINAEDALDKVFESTGQAVVVDDIAWESYKRRKPGRAEHLKDFLRSEPFPDSAVVYRADYMDAATLDRFRQALLHADQTALGRQLLTLWSMTEFQKVPKDYMKMVTEIGKIYPAPHTPDKLTATHPN